MSIYEEKKGDVIQEHFQAGKRHHYLRNKDKPESINIQNALKALDYLNKKNNHYSGIEERIILMLPHDVRDQYITKRIKELQNQREYLVSSLSDSELKRQYSGDRTKVRPMNVKELATFESSSTHKKISKLKIVVYGLSTEGYSIACQMAIKGSDVSIIDEYTPSAISLESEIAKTYPNVSALKKDEPLLKMTPIDKAIVQADYIFFAPRIKKSGKKIRDEIYNQLKEISVHLKKKSSFVNCLPTGIGENIEIMNSIENLANLRLFQNREIQYFYYPIGHHDFSSKFIGSFDMYVDEKLEEVLSTENNKKKIVSLQDAESGYVASTSKKNTQLFKLN